MARRGVKREPERVELTEEQQNILLSYADLDPWDKIGETVGQWLQDAVEARRKAGIKTRIDKRDFYERCGVLVKKSGSTVRQYHALAEYTKDVRDEFPQFGPAHWMLFRAQAKRENRHVWEVARDWAGTEGDYAGWPVRTEVVAAANKAKGAAKSQDIGVYLERAYRALDEARALAEGEAWDAVNAALEGVAHLQERYGADACDDAVDDMLTYEHERG